MKIVQVKFVLDDQQQLESPQTSASSGVGTAYELEAAIYLQRLGFEVALNLNRQGSFVLAIQGTVNGTRLMFPCGVKGVRANGRPSGLSKWSELDFSKFDLFVGIPSEPDRDIICKYLAEDGLVRACDPVDWFMNIHKPRRGLNNGT
jgi:hypothetical protein